MQWEPQSEGQQILRLLHKMHRKLRAILAILDNPPDFSKEDAKVLRMTRVIKKAKQRIPHAE